MRYLLDTHTLLWLDNKPENLPDNVQNICNDSANTLYLSLVSIWEIQIKVTLGKLKIPYALDILVDTQLNTNGLILLPIERPHIYRTDTLPFHHRDPFDRLLIAQAQEENLTFLTKDANITKYSVPVVWE